LLRFTPAFAWAWLSVLSIMTAACLFM